MHSPEVAALEAQLGALTALVDALSDEDFARPTRCPGWAVAELVAHCEGILYRLVGDNARAVGGGAEIDRAGYYRYDPDGQRQGEYSDRTFSEVIRDRVLDEVAGRHPEELRVSLRRAVHEARRGIGEIPAVRVIERAGHPRISFGEFVASRNLEFGVHTMDIAHAVGRPERVEPATAEVITAILDALLGASPPDALGWDDTAYILTGTGRRELGPDERVELGELAPRFPLLR